MATTTNMQLELPTVSSTLGPEWATLLNALIQVIDSHDHSSGKGSKVTPSGILINAALDMVNNKLSDTASLGLNNKSVADTATTGSIQLVGGDLWWITQSGVGVQITSGTSIISSGSGALSLGTISAYPYTVVSGDNATMKIVDCSSARTINMPAATTVMYVYLKDSTGQAQTNNITVVPDGSDLIDGANANFIIDWNDAQIGLISDGVSKWYVI